MLRVNPVIFADIFFKSPCRKLAFLFGKPGCGAREVWQNPEGGKGNADCDGAFDDEKPAPGTEVVEVVHVACYAGGDETGEGAGDEGAGV